MTVQQLIKMLKKKEKITVLEQAILVLSQKAKLS
ncbi:hypothetical protein FW774_08905 [Pedobacter sp. BS3]|nr:hypothetical protein FW774_08905 [Pedobacter sp. BS3]